MLLKKGSWFWANDDSVCWMILSGGGIAMMGRQDTDQSQLFYLFNLERRIPPDHLLRRINPVVVQIMIEVREKLAPFYSDIGRPSVDPELLIRMLIVGYCYGIRSERQLCQEVELHLAYRWFCRLGLEDAVPDHSSPRLARTASVPTSRFTGIRCRLGRPQDTAVQIPATTRPSFRLHLTR